MENILHEIRNCPVAWKPLEELLVRTKGTKITATQMKELHEDGSPIKIFAGGKTVAFVNFGDIPEKDINRDPSIIVKSRGIIEFEYYDAPFSHKNEMWSYHSQRQDLLIKYAYYFLKANEAYFQALGNKMQMPQISTPDTDKYQIPIPYPKDPEKSIAIQSEIVRILDTFTAVASELTSELNARKKQYEYYRDALLTFDTHTDNASKQVSNMQWINLSEAVEIRSGWGFPKTFQGKSSGAYPFYKVSDMNLVGNESLMKKSNNFIDEISAEKLGVTPAPAGTVIFPKIGAAIATNKKRLLSTPSAYDNNIMGLIPKDCIAPRFLFFWMQTVNLVELANDSGAVPSIRKSEMEKLKFPLLPIEKQNRIVAILDKFDTLTHSITDGLPREIELRQKQYAYYRDLLFSFA